jgi:hypothetical protein
MKSEKEIQRYLKVLREQPLTGMGTRALEWVLGKIEYPTDRDLNILEETYKDAK